MNELDRSLVVAMNSWISEAPGLAQVLVQLAFNDLAKGIFALSLVYGLWFSSRASKGTERGQRRARILSGLLALGFALALNRIIASLLPFVERPLRISDLALTLAPGLSRRAFDGLSAFPSDHAVLFGGLAALIARESWKLGAVALFHAAVICLLPRMILGLHWPSDILTGAVLGALFVLVLGAAWPLRALAQQGLILAERHPGLASGLTFTSATLLALLFDPLVRLFR